MGEFSCPFSTVGQDLGALDLFDPWRAMLLMFFLEMGQIRPLESWGSWSGGEDSLEGDNILPRISHSQLCGSQNILVTVSISSLSVLHAPYFLGLLGVPLESCGLGQQTPNSCFTSLKATLGLVSHDIGSSGTEQRSSQDTSRVSYSDPTQVLWAFHRYLWEQMSSLDGQGGKYSLGTVFNISPCALGLKEIR